MNWIKSKYIVLDISKKTFWLSDKLLIEDIMIEDGEYCIKEGALHIKGNQVESVCTPVDYYEFAIPNVEEWHECSIKTIQVKGPWNWFRNRGTIDKQVFRWGYSVPKDYDTSPFYKIYSEFTITDLREQKDNGLEN